MRQRIHHPARGTLFVFGPADLSLYSIGVGMYHPAWIRRGRPLRVRSLALFGSDLHRSLPHTGPLSQASALTDSLQSAEILRAEPPALTSVARRIGYGLAMIRLGGHRGVLAGTRGLSFGRRLRREEAGEVRVEQAILGVVLVADLVEGVEFVAKGLACLLGG
jgi:hypothetical protein